MSAVISGRGRERLVTLSRFSGRLPEKWVDQSGASCHVIMHNFHVSMYSSILCIVCGDIARGLVQNESIAGIFHKLKQYYNQHSMEKVQLPFHAKR